jgi:hypothetical protein
MRRLHVIDLHRFHNYSCISVAESLLILTVSRVSTASTHVAARDVLFSLLLVYVFGISYRKVMSHFYLYHEGQAKRGHDVICSPLLDYVTNRVSEAVKQLHIFVPTAVLDEIQTILLRDLLQRWLLMGNSAESFNSFLPENLYQGF